MNYVIIEPLRGDGMKLAIYDFDGTLVHANTLPLLFKRWKQKNINESSRKPIWRKIMIRYLFHKLHLFGWDKRKFNPYTMELTIDLFRSTDMDTLLSFLQEHYQHLRNYIPEDIKNQIKQDNQAGYHTVLLSGNYDLILNPFQEIGFDSIIGTISSKDGTLLSSSEVEVIIQQGKADQIKHHFPNADLSESKAYADSGYDIPILELVGHPVAVSPDSKLRDYATKRQWDILDPKK